MTPTMEHFLPQRKKGFSALCVFDIGGDEMRHITDYQWLPKFTKNPSKPLNTGTFYLPRVTKVH